MITTIIVDDEPLAREGIRLLLADDPEFQIVAECENGQKALEQIELLHPQVLFLDIQMPEMSGFDVVRAFDPEDMPLFVFVTAYDSFALAAFESHALDYVLKPVDKERFARTLEWIKRRLQEKELSDLPAKLLNIVHQQPAAAMSTYPDRIPIRTGERIYFVGVDEIDWIEAADYYVILHTGKKTHLLRESLSSLIARLDPRKFRRIHRSTIVSLSQIQELRPHFQNEHQVILKDSTALKLGPSYKDALSDILNRS